MCVCVRICASVRICGWGVSAVQRSKRTNSVEEGVCHRDKWGSAQWGTPVPLVQATSSDTDVPSDKPQLPRCNVPLSKSRQYFWHFCTLVSLCFREMWGFVQLCIYRYTKTISVHTHIHTHTGTQSTIYISSKLHFVSHTLTLTPNIAVLGFCLQRNVWCGKVFFTSMCWGERRQTPLSGGSKSPVWWVGLVPLWSYDLWREYAWKCQRI